MFEQAFKNIDDVLWKEAGCTTELDYTEQTSWLLFLKYLDSLEQDKAMEAELEGKNYAHILDKPYHWESWAAPKGQDSQCDHHTTLTGDDLRDFVNQKLFPYLHGFTQKATGPNTLEYKIGQIFGEIKNKISSGYNLREIIDHIDQLRFRLQAEKHELSHLKILKAGGCGGVVIKNTFLSNTNNASVSLRKLLLESGNLHTVLDCPGGTFQGAGVKTVVLFFEKGMPTIWPFDNAQGSEQARKVWYYQLDPGRNLGKTNPLNDADLAEFIELQKIFADSSKSWSIDANSIDQTTFDLSVKNPNGGEEVTHRSPQEIMEEIAALDAESAGVLLKIKELL